MPARSGSAYVESLKKHAPYVYLGGRRVLDVTAEPIFQEPIRAIAEQYDMQLDPAYREVMTYPSPTTGRARLHLVPRAVHPRGPGEEAQALQAAGRPQLRLHGAGARLHEPVRHGLAPDGRPLRSRGRALRRERHPLLRARAGARPVPHAHAAGFYAQYEKEPLFELVERALGRREGEPIPIPPDHPGAPIPYKPGTRGMAGTYAATSLSETRKGS